MKKHLRFISIITALVGICYSIASQVLIDTYTGGVIYDKLSFFGLCFILALISVVRSFNPLEHCYAASKLVMAVVVDCFILYAFFFKLVDAIGAFVPVIVFFPLALILLLENVEKQKSTNKNWKFLLLLSITVLLPKILWMVQITR
ncbi:MAG: hypothetical protein R2795_15345 [Saprospiraceae bacterium]